MAFYLPLLAAAIVLFLLVVLRYCPSLAQAKISGRLVWSLVGFAGLGGIVWGISYEVGQMQVPRLGPVPTPLAAGTKLPRIEAQGWLNGPPPLLNDKPPRVLVVEIWGEW